MSCEQDKYVSNDNIVVVNQTYVPNFTNCMTTMKIIKKNYYTSKVNFTFSSEMDYSRKKSTPPQRMGSFLTPLSPGFPEAQDPQSCLDFQDKIPPSRLDFCEKILGLNLIFFDIKYAQSCLEDVLF